MSMSTLHSSVSPLLLDFAASERSRPLGSDYPPQSQVYLFYLPFVLMCFGLAIWLIPNNATFALGAIVGSLVGLYALWDIALKGAPLRFTTLYAMSLMLGYNLGALNSWITVDRANLTLAEFFARDPADLARAIAICMASSALLFAIGEVFERPVFGEEFRLNFDKAVPIVVVSTALLLAGHATGRLGYQGITVGQGGHISPLAELIMWWCIPAFAYSVCATLNTAGPVRWILGLCTLVQLVAFVPFGRRVFVFSLLLAVIATRLGNYRFRMPFLKKLLIGVLGVALIVTASVSFIYLRFAKWQHKEDISLRTQIENAMDIAQKRSPTEVLQFMGRDVSTRTFMLGFFSDLLEASQHSSPMFGRDMLRNVLLTVPSVISKDKFGVEPYPEEIQVNMQWGFSYIDEANSLLTAGAADFGIIGVLIYPFLIIFFFRAALELLQWALPSFLGAIIALGFVYETLQAEDAPIGYFIQIRNAATVLLILYIIYSLPKFRLRPAS